MPSPTASDVFVSVPLTSIAVAYTQDTDQFIADKVFPNIPVQMQAGRYWKYDRNYWFRAEAAQRAPSTESAGSGWVLDNTPTYFCELYAIHKDIDDQVRANAVAPINMDRDAAKWVAEQLLIKREQIWSSKYFTTGVWTGQPDAAGVTAAPAANQFLRWDQAGSTPVEDITNAVDRVNESTGYRPNTLVLSPYVFRRLTNNAEFLDRIKFTQRGIVTEEILAAVLGVDKVLVARGVNNTTAEGAVTQTNSFIMGKSALLVYAAPAPGILVPSGGYTFAWQGYLGAGGAGQRVTSMRMDWIKSDRIEGEISFDCEIVGPDLGAFWSAAVS